MSVAPAEVGAGTLSKYTTRQLAGGKLWVVCVGLGPPRLWSYGIDAALAGFAKGFTSAGSLEAAAALKHCYAHGRRSLVDACNSLIEKAVPDVAFLGLAFDHISVHVLGVGPVRAYLHRGRQPQRLTPRDEGKIGMLDGQPITATSSLDPGDLILAGSESAFSTRAVGRVAAVLQTDPNTPPSVLATLLSDPARKAGVGAAALVLRVR